MNDVEEELVFHEHKTAHMLVQRIARIKTRTHHLHSVIGLGMKGGNSFSLNDVCLLKSFGELLCAPSTLLHHKWFIHFEGAYTTGSTFTTKVNHTKIEI